MANKNIDRKNLVKYVESTKNLTYVCNCVSEGRTRFFTSHMFLINYRHFMLWHLHVSFHKSFCGAGLINFALVI